MSSQRKRPNELSNPGPNSKNPNHEGLTRLDSFRPFVGLTHYSKTPEGKEIETEFYDVDNNIWFQISLFRHKTYVHIAQGTNPFKAEKDKRLWIGKCGMGKLIKKVLDCRSNPEDMTCTTVDEHGWQDVNFRRTKIPRGEWESERFTLTSGTKSVIEIERLDSFYVIQRMAIKSCMQIQAP